MGPGLLLCSALTGLGWAISALPWPSAHGASPLVIALLLGMLVGNSGLGKRLAHCLQPGLSFATRRLLRLGIVLFGLSLTLQQVYALGPGVLLLDVAVIAGVFLVGYPLGTRVLGMDRETTLLTCAGSAICGAAAILATETTLRARPAATAMAVATVVLFGTLAMLLYPVIYASSSMNEGLYGVYIGATVHEVAQVVAAADAVGSDALANALIVKLVRVMLLVPFLLLLSQWWRRQATPGQAQGALVIPWFALGFVLTLLLNSYLDLPIWLREGLIFIGQIALTMAMAALGLGTRFVQLKALGLRPFLLGFCLFGLLLTGGALLTPLLVTL